MANMTAPPYRQLLGLVNYLYISLRYDAELFDAFGLTLATDKDIIASSYTRHPATAEDNSALVWTSELPTICAYNAPGWQTIEFLGQKQAHIQNVNIVYAMHPYVGSETVARDTWSENWVECIWWRICEYLRRDKFPTEAGESWSGLVPSIVFHYDEVEPKRMMRLQDDNFDGMLAEVELSYIDAPYNKDAAGDLATIELEIDPVTPDGLEPLTVDLVDLDD